MSKLTKKTTICFEPEILEYVRAKAADDSRSVFDIIHRASKVLFVEDRVHIAIFDACIGEPSVAYDHFFQLRKADGIILNRLQAVG